MSLSELTSNLDIIKSLADIPSLPADQLKGKFDEGALAIKSYLNTTLTKQIDSSISSLQTSVNNKLDKSNGGSISGTLTLNSGLRVNSTGTTDGIELYGSTPYIDFHYSNSTSDYTSRIMEDSSKHLLLKAENGVNFDCDMSLISIRGASIAHTFVHTPNSGHYIVNTWDDNNTRLILSVDNAVMGYFNLSSTSDRRLKTDISEIDENVIKAIGEVKFKQFKITRNNPNNQISFGIIAQELIESFEKYGLNINDYNIISTIIYEDNIEYYIVNYEQFNILRNAYNELKQKELEERIAKLENS